MLSIAVFWGCMALATWVYVLYPGLVIWLARHRHGTNRFEGEAGLMGLTVVIAAHNEQGRIAERVRDVLAQDYPADRLQVVVVSDGSTDHTADAAAIGDPRVTVLRNAQNEGKAVALNLAMDVVGTPLVAFTDARQRFAPGALRALASAFADPEVGAASGELVFLENNTGPQSHAGNIGLYWKIELALRTAEARLGWLHGVSGAIHAMRRELYRPLPAGTLLDDVAIPFNVLRAGYRVDRVPGAG